MNEQEYYASEITDQQIDAIADAGDFHLDEQGFQYRLRPGEISALCAEGRFYLATCQPIVDHETEIAI